MTLVGAPGVRRWRGLSARCSALLAAHIRSSKHPNLGDENRVYLCDRADDGDDSILMMMMLAAITGIYITKPVVSALIWPVRIRAMTKKKLSFKLSTC